MSVTLENIAFDCADAAALATFWAGVLSTEVDAEANEFFATVNRAADGPTLMFLQVPEPRSGKNRWHLDFYSNDPAGQVNRALELGAEKQGDFDEYGAKWTTLADPEGNVFDIGAAHD